VSKENVKIRGVLAIPRVSLNGYLYLPEELENAVKKANEVPIYLEHVSANNAVGVAKLIWNPEKMRVEFEGEVFDEEVEKAIRAGAIKHVSLGADYDILDFFDSYSVPRGLEFRELSLVAIPGIPEANLEVVESAQKEFEIDIEEIRARQKVIERAVKPHETPKADEDKEWDADAAIARIRKWASTDGSGEKDKIDWEKYRQAFAWYDENDPENFGSYKLPHHDIVDGKFVVVWRGVAAAMAALMGARGGVDIPNEDWDSVYSHLKKHYEQFDKEPPAKEATKEEEKLPEKEEKEEPLPEKEEDIEKQKNTSAEVQQPEIKMSEEVKIEENKVEEVKAEGAKLPLFEAEAKIAEAKTLESWRKLRKVELAKIVEAITNVPSLTWHSDLLVLPPELAPDLQDYVQVRVLKEGESSAKFHKLPPITFSTLTEGTEPSESSQAIATIEVTPTELGAMQTVTYTQLETSAVDLLSGVEEALINAAAAALDKMVIDAVNSADVTNFVDGTSGTFNENLIINALELIKKEGKFQIKPGDIIVVVHPKQFADLLKRDVVKTAMYFGGAEPIRMGVIPQLFGCVVIESTQIPKTTESGTDYYHAIAFKRDDAVGLAFGRELLIETDRVPSQRLIKIVGTIRAAAKAIVPELCCKIKTQ